MVTLSRRTLVPCRHIDRLPRGADPAVGAGYSMAAAATAATLGCYALYTLVSISLVGLLGGGSVATNVPGVVGGMGLYAVGTLALVVPGAFLAGLLVWRYAPERFRGAVGGLLATLGTYLVTSAVVGLALATYAVLAAPPGYFGGLVQSVLIYLFMLLVAVAYTFWAAVPAGVAAGWLYERSRAVEK